MEPISVPDNVARGHYIQARSRVVTLVYFVLVIAIVISLALSYRNEASASRSIARQAALVGLDSSLRIFVVSSG